MSVREQVPKSLRMPIGFLSIALMIVGITMGYIFTMFGITLIFDLNALRGVSTTEAVSVTLFGVGSLIAGYFGWKGFLYFSY